MHSLDIPNIKKPHMKSKRAMITSMFESAHIVWAETSEGYSLFNLDDALLAQVNLGCTILFTSTGGFTLSERVTTAPSVPEEPAPVAPGPITFYQFAARVRANTGRDIALDVMDRPIKFAETDDGFIYAIERTSYVETSSRYRVQSTRLVLTFWSIKGDKWVRDEVSTPTEKAPDLIKYGKVLSPEEYWATRRANAAEVNWNTRDMKLAIEAEKIARRILR